MTKKLNTLSIINELRGASPFFPSIKEETEQEMAASTPPPPKKAGEPRENTTFVSKGADQPISHNVHQQGSNPVNTQPSNQASLHASTPASMLASRLATQPDIIEIIRKIVKTPAKEEVLYVRVTKEEKNQLGDIEYTYDRQDIETSANELGRIAINFLIADYKANGENSILVKVLTALHA